jgi:predicted dehydrogenase
MEERSMKTYKVGIVGLGWVAGSHIMNFNEMPNFEVTAVMSRRKLDSAEVKAQHGVDVKIYNDYDKMLEDESIDVIDICTPHPFHPEQTIKAAEAGKQIIIEKPLGIAFEDTVRMLEAVEKNKVKTSVCFEVRFMGVTKAMESIIKQGLIGDIYLTECDYFHGIGPWYGQFEWNVKKNMGGSSLLTAGCHALDAMLYLVDDAVDEVFTYSTTNPHEVYKPYEYDTTTVTMLKFKNGTTLGKCSSVCDCMQPYVFNMNMVGSHGSIKNDLFFSKKIAELRDWTKMDVQLIDSGDVAHHPYKLVFSHFAECLDGDREPLNNLASAFETHRVIFAADHSAETGKPVSLKDFSR